jgi:hypothetical protein
MFHGAPQKSITPHNLHVRAKVGLPFDTSRDVGCGCQTSFYPNQLLINNMSVPMSL